MHLWRPGKKRHAVVDVAMRGPTRRIPWCRPGERHGEAYDASPGGVIPLRDMRRALRLARALAHDGWLARDRETPHGAAGSPSPLPPSNP